MKSYLSMIPISARVHKQQNKRTVFCIAIAVFLVTAVFSMMEMAARQETARLIEKHGTEEVASLFASEAFLSLLPIAMVLFLFVLCAGVLMIAGSMNSNVARRTQLFGMMRCIGMSKKQVARYVRLEALHWCKTAVPAGLLAGTAAAWLLCAALKFGVGGEWADMPQLGISFLGISSGVVAGILTVLIAAGEPARKASRVTPLSALSGGRDAIQAARAAKLPDGVKIEKALGVRHAAESKKNLLLMTGSFALSILLFLSFSVFVDLVNCLMPQSESAADLELYAKDGEWIDRDILAQLNETEGVKRAFGRRALFEVAAGCDADPSIETVDLISQGEFDLEALRKDGLVERGSDLEAVIEGGCALVITDGAARKGDTVSAFGTQLPIAGKLKYDPFSADGSAEGKTTLIVSDETFQAITGVSGYTMLLIQLSNSATDENVEAIKAQIGEPPAWNDNRENNTHGTYLAFLICVYSFLGIIALVTVLNIVNSISMSVSAKTRQYGAMRAIGMSKKQLAGMITAQALTYACLGCGSGLFIGLLCSKWLYDALVTSHFAYAVWRLPVGEMAVVAAFFALSVAAGVRKPIRQLEEMSITETINQL